MPVNVFTATYTIFPGVNLLILGVIMMNHSVILIVSGSHRPNLVLQAPLKSDLNNTIRIKENKILAHYPVLKPLGADL
jgi:hypothetical protein